MYEPPRVKTAEETRTEADGIHRSLCKDVRDKVVTATAAYSTRKKKELTDETVISDLLLPDEIPSLLEEIAHETHIPITNTDMQDLGITTTQKRFLFVFPYTSYSCSKTVTLADVTNLYINKLQ